MRRPIASLCTISLAILFALSAVALASVQDDQPADRPADLIPPHLVQILAGQVDVEALRAAVSNLRTHQDDLARTGRNRREAALRNVLSARERVIDLVDHPARAVWMADQAADLYQHRLVHGAAEQFARFGINPPEDLAVLQDTVAQMLELTIEAELLLEDLIVLYESQPGYADNIALQSERRRIDDRYRRRQVPFLRGLSALRHGQWNVDDEDERHALLRLARRKLTEVATAGGLDDALRDRAWIYAADAAAGLDMHDDAKRHLAHVLRPQREQYADPVSPLDRLEAQLLMVEITRHEEGESAGFSALRDLKESEPHRDRLLHRLLLADVEFRWLRDRDADSPRAFDAYLALLEERIGDTSRAVVRDLVMQRIGLTVDEHADLDRLPASATLARAEQLLAEGDAQSSLLLYQRIIEEEQQDRDARAAAHMGAGRIYELQEQWSDAHRHYKTVARNYASYAPAERAIEAAGRAAFQWWRGVPHDQEAMEAVDSTLTLLFDRYPMLTTLDTWRLSAGRFFAATDQPQRAIEVWQRIGSASPHRLDARLAEADVRREMMLAAESLVERRERAQRLRDTVAEVLRTIERMDDRPRDVDLQLTVLDAEAWMGLNEPARALEALARIELGPEMDAEIAGRVLTVRVEALRAMGRREEARRELSTLLAADPDAAGPIMLAILQAELEAMPPETFVRLEGPAAPPEALSDTTIELARQLSQWIETIEVADDRWAGAATVIGRGLLLSGHTSRAAAIYDRWLSRNPDALEPTLGRAETLYSYGGESLGQAMLLYRRIASTRSDARDDAFWTAELRMLQILHRTNRNTHRILPRIERLRLIDSGLGGNRFRPHFEQLARTYRER